MDHIETFPKVSFILNLYSIKDVCKDLSSVRHLSQVFENEGIPVAWGVTENQISILNSQGIYKREQELSLAIEPHENLSSKQFQSQLQRNLATLESISSRKVPLILGDVSQLRKRTAILAREGISAILSTAKTNSTSQPKPLPCGLWQLQAAMRYPEPRAFWQLFRYNRLNVERITNASSSIVLIEASELSTLSTRTIQAFEKLLRNTTQAERKKRLSIITAGNLVSNLADLRKIKPQKSILRRAA